MEFEDKDKRKLTRDMLIRAAIVLASIIVIVAVLPHGKNKNFHYDIGKPWMSSALIAKFDIPIYKTDDALQRETDSLLNRFQPYFKLDATVEKRMVDKFLLDYKEGLPGLPAEYVKIVSNRMHRVYQAGVISTKDYRELSTDTTRMIRVINGKEAESVSISYVYSTRTAYEQLLIDEELGDQKAVLQRCNLNDYIQPNIIYDKERSEDEKASMLSEIAPSIGIVQVGEKIVDRGEIIDKRTAQILASLEKESTRRSTSKRDWWDTLIGQTIYVTLMLILFTAYLALFRKDYFEKLSSLALLYTLLTLFPVIVSLFMRNTFFSVYLIPFCIVPVFVRVFMDSRTAFTTHAIMTLLCAVAVKYQYEFMIIQLVAGLVAIYSLRELSKRSQVLWTAFLVTIATGVSFYALQLIQSNDLMKADVQTYSYFVINGVLILLSYPLMYLVETLFGFTSDVTLFELSNTNKGVLRRLSEVAPGTFQHSITVGNLAAEIANKIGADSLLVRTGALYHDIGKLEDPVYFTENQAGVNPHDNISYTQSADIILGHVTGGISMAEKYDLPQLIKDFILTHHGAGMVKYFYIKYKNEHPDEEVSADQFSYPGPNPFTREQAILMMADSVEAASRSLQEYTNESISQLVDRIIDNQVSEGYFRECPITFRDIALAKMVLTERLMNIYHTRISYPKTKEEEENDIEEQLEQILEQNDKATD